MLANYTLFLRKIGLAMLGTAVVMGACASSPASANDGKRLIEGLLGAGAKIIIENEIQRRNDAQQSNTPRMTRSQTRRVQIALNNLGFNAGNPDGVAGRGTRNAISRYQISIGAAPTGYLTQGQLAALINGSGDAAVAETQAPDQTGDQENDELNRAEIRALQTGLNALGYNVGRPDGKAGRRTGRGVSAFLRDRGYDPFTTPPHLALSLVAREAGTEIPAGSKALQTAGSGAGETSVFLSGGDAAGGEAFDPSSYRADGQDGFDLDVELAKRAVFHRPEVIDDKSVLAGWFERVYTSRMASDSNGPDIAKRYHGGTAFERDDALAQFRKQLDAEKTDEPLRIIRRFGVNIRTGDYDADRGLPLTTSKDETLGRQRIYVPHIRRAIEIFFDNLPDISHLPVTDEAAAREIADMFKADRYARLRLDVYMTVTQVGAAVLTDGYSGDDLLTDATLDEVALVFKPSRFADDKTERTLHVWKTGTASGPVASDGMSATDLADWAGVGVVAGHLAAYQNSSNSDYERAWRRILDVGQLAANPALLDHDQAALYLGELILSKKERAFVSRGKPLFGGNRHEPGYRSGSNAFDEFEFPEVMADLRNGFSEKILAHQPAFPMPVVHITPMLLGPYDHERGGFALQNGDNDQRRGISELNDEALYRAEGPWKPERIETGMRSLPDFLQMDAEKGRQLVSVLSKRRNTNNKRVVYVAVFSDVDRPAMGVVRTGNRIDESALIYEMPPKRIGLYADLQLKQLIEEYEPSDGWKSGPDRIDISEDMLLADAEMVALWFAANDPDRLDSEDELRAMMRMRRRVEDEQHRVQSPLGRMLPDVIVNRQERPLPQDLEKFKAVMAAAAGQANFDLLRFPFRITGNVDDTTKNLTVRIDKSLGDYWVEHPVFDESEDRNGNDSIARLIPQKLPNTFGHIQIPSPQSVYAYLAFRNHPAWFEVTIEPGAEPVDPATSGIHLRVTDVWHDSTSADRDIVVFEVEPSAIAYQSQEGLNYRIDIAPVEEDDDTAYPVSSADILGARIGMTLDEAIQAVKDGGFSGTEQRRISSEKYPLGNGLVLFDPGRTYPPHIAFFTKSYGGEERVIGMFRYMPDHGASPDAIVNALSNKYGKPDGGDTHHDGYFHAWGDGEVTKKLIQAEGFDHECVLEPLRGHELFKGETMFVNAYNLEKACGVVLSTYVDQNMYLLLIDTNTVIGEKLRLAEEKQRQREEAEKAKNEAADIKL